jgi:hypothetical protein
MTYAAFLDRKVKRAPAIGVPCDMTDMDPRLFMDFQRHIIAWSVRRGRGAIWATTGTGKTRMELKWSQASGDRSLIVAPLAVCQQTIREAAAIDVPAAYARDDSEAAGPGVWVTNYERVAGFDPEKLDAVALDEASILKQSTGRTRTALIRHFAGVRRRTTWTATPAPNDIEELTNQAEFLGIMPRAEMLAAYFVHDDTGWRVKGHARRPMFGWMASWAVALRKPSDLGYSDGGFELPPLTIVPEIVASDVDPGDALFPTLGGVSSRARIRRETMADRADRASSLALAEPTEQWVAWCDLNAEADRVAAAVPGAVNVHGSLSPEDKAAAFLAFADGQTRVLVTKPSIAAFGLNLQGCARMAFVGLSDSYERYFQAIRRCWRYGQTREVRAHVVLSDIESGVAANIRRKERETEQMMAELVSEMRAAGQGVSA